MMHFVFPNETYEEKARDFILEFYNYSSPINGVGGLDRYLRDSSYTQWLQKVTADIDIANVPLDRVPALTYFYVRENDDTIIGMVNVRLGLTPYLCTEGGHIGYCIRPLERLNHYGTRMLKDTLTFCERIGLDEILISCSKTNLASSCVIKNCGGVLKEEFFSDSYQEIIQRYIIKSMI